MIYFEFNWTIIDQGNDIIMASVEHNEFMAQYTLHLCFPVMKLCTTHLNFKKFSGNLHSGNHDFLLKAMVCIDKYALLIPWELVRWKPWFILMKQTFIKKDMYIVYMTQILLISKYNSSKA